MLHEITVFLAERLRLKGIIMNTLNIVNKSLQMLIYSDIVSRR